ncbi:hypothetical protein F2Q69_00037588 [Brassica cretica]|uniref:Uncharacterized protein n=1 Tax=Brassica cretica TaxID=69181 RepID=A0A8S9SRU3_BRACR|nr:hypothetical protein F2Q69_00037588 [Brassica cretica]
MSLWDIEDPQLLLKRPKPLTVIDKLKQEFNQAQQKSSHSLSKYELLAETNNQLKIKIQQLEGLLGSSSTEKEAAMKQLEEQVTLERSKPNTLVSEIEKLKEVAAEKSVLESHVEELEKTLKKYEAQLKEEVKNATAASKELQAAQISIAEQKQAKSQKHSELEAALKQSQELKKYNSPVFLNPSTHNHINRASRPKTGWYVSSNHGPSQRSYLGSGMRHARFKEQESRKNGYKGREEERQKGEGKP